MRAEGVNAIAEIMLPLIGERKEFDMLAAEIREVAKEVANGQRQGRLRYLIGTMIEVPRACIEAGQSARSRTSSPSAPTILTQMTYGLSRDDSSKFPRRLSRARNLPEGSLSGTRRRGCRRPDADRDRARAQGQQKAFNIGICGEHGGDPASVKFCHRLGLDYVSCSPFRLPVAKLAAAQAAIEDLKAKTKREFKDV